MMLNNAADEAKMEGQVEGDETYIGGKIRPPLTPREVTTNRQCSA
jgi:hypothetical protein